MLASLFTDVERKREAKRKRTQRLHANSREAYRAERSELKARSLAILVEVRVNGQGTDRQIKDRMGFTEMNAVRPRITELVDAGLLREMKTVKCEVTGRPVRVVNLGGGLAQNDSPYFPEKGWDTDADACLGH